MYFFRIIIFSLVNTFILFIPAVHAQSITNIYELPNELYFNHSYGLTSDSNSIYLSSGSSSSPFKGWIFEFDLNGTKLDSFATGLDESYGLAWDGNYFWYAARTGVTTFKFFKVSSTGTAVDSIALPSSKYVGGLYWDGSGLWYSLYYPNNEAAIYKLDVSTGSIIDTINTKGTQPQGITNDGQYFYYAMDDNDGDPENIYIYDPFLNDTIGYIPVSDPISQSPRGLAWDGQNLWLVADPVGSSQRALFKFNVGGGGTPNIQLPVTSLDFGLVSVGDTMTLALNIQNIGDSTLNIPAIDIDTSVYFFDQNILPLEIGAGQNHVLDVSFSPKGQGPVAGILSIHSNDPYEPVIYVTLTGQGQFVNPTIWLSATSHNYGNVWLPGEGVAHWILSIVNTGNSDLEIVDLIVNQPEFYTGGYSTFPITIVPNDTFDLSVYFSPSLAQTFVDTLYVGSTDPSQPWTQVVLSGTGVAGPFNLGYQFWNYQVPDNPVTSFQQYRPLALKPIEDVTGDGNPDVLIATRNYWTICLDGAGSGMNYDVWRFSSYINNYSAGGIGNTNDLPPQQKAMAISEDLNGDGFQDVVIGTGASNEHVYALDGTDGSIIWQFGTDHPDSSNLGDITSVNTDVDFNGDQIKDVIAAGSATNNGIEGRRSVYCFNGPDGTILWQFFVGSFIRSAVPIGDVNGNGHIDVVAVTGDGVSNTYSVVAIESSGPSGPTPIWSFPIGSGPGGGKDVIRYDVPNETADVIAGAYFGLVYRIDGETGLEVWQSPFDLGFKGIYHLSTIEDVDDDGLDDILVASFDSSFYCLGGADGDTIWSRFLGNSSWSAQAIPDLNGDQQEDVVVASKTDILYVLDGTDGTSLLEYPMNSGMLQGATLANIIPDLDNNGSFEILGASDDGKIVALAGGEIPIIGIKPGTSSTLPQDYGLHQNYPNPFNPSTTISFDLPEQSMVAIHIYDVLGRLIKSFSFKNLPAGTHEVVWDGTNQHDVIVPSGIYIYQASLNEYKISRQMLLLK
jgi:hypothetical protein